jgi:hypothetical protein
MMYPETESPSASETARLFDMLKFGCAEHNALQEINSQPNSRDATVLHLNSS